MHIHLKLAMKGMEALVELQELKQRFSNLEREAAERELEITQGKHKINELKGKISSFLTYGRLQWKIAGVRKKVRE